MKRRQACAAVSLASLLLQGTDLCVAQAAGKVYKIGVLELQEPTSSGVEWQAFVAELAKRGYVEGRNLVFEKRVGEFDRIDLLDKLAAELVSLKVDVIYAASGTAAARAAKKATASLPIVFFGSADPVGLGLIASLARPGGNLTGSSAQILDVDSKSLEYLAVATGKLTMFAWIQHPTVVSQPWYNNYAAALRRAASSLGVSMLFVDVPSLSEIESSLARLVREGVNGVALLGPRLPMDSSPRQIAAAFIRHRLPSIGNPQDGFLLEYRVPEGVLGRMAAGKVDRIFQGAKPADLPVEQASVFELVINLKTAKELALKVPQGLMMRADLLIQ